MSVSFTQNYSSKKSVVVFDKSINDLVFIDANIDDKFDKIFCDADDNAFLLLNRILTEARGLDSLHIFSHGAPGALLLGNGRIDAERLLQCSELIKTWQPAFAENAQIVLYGCEVGQGELGREFVNLLARLLNVDVVASTQKVGANTLGGRWLFDVATGDHVGPLALNANARAAYAGVFETLSTENEQVNAFASNNQDNPAIAVLAGGSYVVTWTSYTQDGTNSYGVYAQRFTASGVPMGPEFRINSTTSGNQSDASVAALSSGGFVVTWTDSGKDGSGDGVYGQRYDANGVAQGGEFKVNATTASTQNESSVAAYTGGFIVAWTSYGNAGDPSSYGVYAQRYDNSGVAVGGEFRVNTTTAGYQYESDVAARADGSYVVVWRSDGQDGSSAGVYAQRYDTSGVAQGGEILVNTYTTGNQYEAKVTTLTGGGFVVVWRSDGQDGSSAGVYGQRFLSDGSKDGTEFRINESTTGGQYQPDVTALANGGFAVTWYNDSLVTGSYYDVFVREYNSAGAAVTGQIKANTPDNNTQSQPVIAHLGSDNYAVVWTGNGNEDGSGNGIFQQLFGTVSELPRQVNPAQGDFTGTVTFGENLVNATPQVIDHLVSLTDIDSANFAGGRVELFYTQFGGTQDQLGVRNQGADVAQIGVSGSTVTFNDGTGVVDIGTISGGANGAALAVNLNANATVDAVEALIQNLTYANTSGNPEASRTVVLRVYDGDGGTSNAGTITINVVRETDGTPVAYGEEQVNTYIPSTQEWPSIATLNDGSYVVTWVSNLQDGDGQGIYAQRFANNGEAIGPEFRVNSLIGGQQDWPQIAALSNGGYVITWEDNGNDGSGYGVYGQRYDANSVAQGSQFLLNTTTSGTQYHDNVAAYTGGFAAVWSTGNDIYLQRFDNAGTKQGSETLVSTTPGNPAQAQAGAQYVPDVAAYANGNLVIVWADTGGNDGSSYGVYGRTYNAGAGTFGSTFLVNTTTNNDQSYGANGDYVPNVAVLANGDFVVVWPSYDQDSNNTWGVIGQRFNASGAKLGGEFQVNETTAGRQYMPDVTGLSTGGFVVTWYSDDYDISGTGSYNDVYIREYDAAGNAIDGQRKLDMVTNTPSNQEYQPAIADLGNGNYAVVYADYVPANDGGNATFEITQQIFGNTAELARSASPQLVDFIGTTTFAENMVNATMQVIDAAVGLSDPDSGNFNGGRLDLYYIQNGAAEDQLGVVNQGNGAGQIGVSGNTVSYGGTAIGTLSGGSNGANLRIDLTSNAATVDAVEALIQRLGYANTDSSPNTSRTLGLRVSDGDGGTSQSNVLTINVTREIDGTPAAYGEEQVNTFTGSNQEWPAVATLTDGSYVVAWQSYTQDGTNSWGIYAQRFANNGEAIGPEFRVNSLTTGDQSWSQIAALSDGGYVVVWQDDANDGSGYGVYGQRYDANSVAQGSQFLLNTTTSGTQYHDNVAAYTGGFAAVWSTGNDIYLQRFDNAGAKQSGETLVSTTPGNPAQAQAGAQYVPDVAAYANGNLVIVWQDGGNDGSSYGVYGRTYNAGAGTFGSTFLVNTTTSGNQSYGADGNYAPNVAVLANGDFVVVWPSDSNDGSGWAVIGQRFNASGVKLGGEFQVNETTAGSQYIPDVTALSTGGFVVSFYNDNYDVSGTGSTADVYIREYDNAGNAMDGQRKVNTTMANSQFAPAVTDLGNGNYAVVWNSYQSTADGGNNTYEIMQQLFGNTAELPRSASPQLVDFIGTVAFAENTVNAGMQVIDAAVGLSDPDSANFNGGRLDLYYIQNGATQDQLGVVHQGTGAGQIGVSGSTVSYGGTAIGTISGGTNGANLRIDFASDAATADAVEALMQRLGYQNGDSSPNPTRTMGLRVSDGDGGTSTPSVLTINVTKEADGTPLAYGEERVSTYTPSTQGTPALTTLSGGGYVTVWTSVGQDVTSTDGVYAQRFTSSGVAVGPEFRVNSTTAAGQSAATVGALSTGGFVVVWTDTSGTDGSGAGVYAQRFDANGVAQGSETLVNAYTNSTQQQPSVVGYTGGFVVSWSSNGNAGGSGFDIYIQRFDNAGAKVGVESRVNTTLTNTQSDPDIAARADGSYVVVWVDQGGADGNLYGVYAQRFDNTGTKAGSEMLVNTFTTGYQYEPKVATLSDGGFVVVWRDDTQDGSSAGVYGQRFDSAGAKVGSEFRVNESTTGGQYQPDVTGLSTGGFVVTWYNDNYDVNGTGSSDDIYIREYDVAGNAIDGQRKLESNSNSTEYQPAITDLGNGNYVVAYVDYATAASGGNNSYEIVQQVFGSTGEIPRQANPLFDDVREQRIVTTASATTAQLIDADVGLVDVDSANFDGGLLRLQFLDKTISTHTSENLAIRNQGTGSGQISVSGSDVSYGGVTIGTFAGGGAGTDLLVNLNSSATPAAVRALVENLTYQHTVPVAGSTYLGIRLTDGDGGASAPIDVQVTIQASYTPPTVDLTDIEPATMLTEAQAQAGVLVDDAVQLNYNGAGSFNNGSLTVSYVSSTGRVEDQLSIRNEGTGTGQVGVSGSNVSYAGTLIGTINAADTGANGDLLVVNFNASATDQAIERVIENLRYQTTSDGPNPSRTISIVVKDSANTASTASQMQIDIAPQTDGVSKLFGEQQVNIYEPNDQHVTVVAGLQGPNDGGYVVVWRSYTQDGDTYGIYGQRFDAKGAAVGAEFQVNSYTPGDQSEPAVTSLTGGGFVTVWRSTSQDGSGYGIYAQVYGADGAPVGGELLVNSSTTSHQYEPAVVGLSDGTFVVSYRSDYTNAAATYLYDVLAQRFDANGAKLGGEFTINTTTTGTQYEPSLAALPGGKFVALWSDASGNDGSSYGVFARVFNSDGTQAVAEQVVNTTISGQQSGHDVVALSGGGYVAVWWSADNQIHGQRFDSAGAKAGGEFQVSTVDTAANNNWGRVAALDNGGFVVAWDATGYEVFVQQFDASGNKVDGPTVVNSTTASVQYYPDIAGLTGSNFVVTWAGYNQEPDAPNNYGIFTQIMGTSGSITRSAAPELVDINSAVTFAENLVNATPQLIDSAVKLSDVDSANLNGGQLVVAIIPAGQNQYDLPFSQDQLAIQNQGTGAGQVGVSGSNVSYGGTTIGTITSNGANGNDLVVNLNASATTQAVEAVIEHLTYANNSTIPAASRLVSIQVSDGAGGASDPRTVQINVTPEVDGASKLFGEQQVNTYEPDQQYGQGVTGLQGPNAGSYVVIWRSDGGQDGDTYGVYAQRYDAKGAALGAELQVNSQTLGDQDEQEVASLANGGFVAVWNSGSQDGSGYSVHAQVYDSDGAPVGGEFRVNTSTPSNQYEPAVVGLSDGSFIVAYRSDYTNAAASYVYDVLAKHYSATGTLLNDEFTLNTTTAGTQFEPRLAALSGGQFVALYGDASGNDGNGYGMFSRVFNSNGSQAVAEQLVNTTTSSNQYNGDVAALTAGGYVAVWWSGADDQIYGQRFDAAGAKSGGEFRISSIETVPYNDYARVTALDNGGFVVVWDASGGPGGSAQDVFVQQYDASGNKVDGPTLVNSTIASTQYYPDIAGLTNGNFVVTWSGYNQEASTANTYGVFSQIMGTPGSIVRSAAPELVDISSAVTFAENLVNSTPQLIDSAVRLSDVDSANFNGGQLVVSVISGYGSIDQAQLPQDAQAQDQFGIRSQGAGAGQVSVSGSSVSYGGSSIGTITTSGSNGADLVVTFNANATAPAVEAVIENLTYQNSVSNPVPSRTVSIQVSDGAGGASAASLMQVNVTPEFDGGQPLFQEEVVNTYTPGTQSEPAMARLADGGYVTVWTSTGQDGWGDGIYGQRYDAQGVAVGNQFQVNDYTPYDQTEPAIAGLSGGGFVVVFRSQNQDSSGAGVYAQRYDANSVQVGDAVLVNSQVTSNQYQAAVASVPGGGYVVAWYSDGSQDGRSADVFFQRFDGNGQAVGTQTRANTSTGFENNAQYEPAITVLNDGTFVVTWRADSAQDSNLSGVYGQRFAANGTTLGSEFRINTYTDSYQYDPSIAALTGGGFVVTWASYYQDGGSTNGVFAQRYSNDGTPQGDEFRVNTTTASNEYQPSVSALGNGGFVMAWTNGSQIYVQQFNAGGVPVDGETRVDVKDVNWASQPVVQGLNNGNFVVSWNDYQDDASANSYGIFQRLFGNPADFVRQANPDLVDVASSVTFLENDVNLVPQLIDPGVGLFDADSTNFAGGRLEVDYISGYGGQDQLGFEGLENQDQLGIRNEGNGPTQVGVSGLGVFYSGVQIGSINAAANGANHGRLMVEFNANATPEAVESVIENLTYQNLASNPFATRTISVRVSDGDGGSSDAHFITLNVTPEVDGAVPKGLERQVNTTLANTQEQPSITHLADGGYVVVWQSYNQDVANTWGVYGQRYDANDNAVGSEFRVNTATASSQYEPEVVGLSGGGYVVVWRSDSQDGGSAGVYSQRYDSNGTAAGSEFRVNESTVGGQYQPDLAALANGGFAVTWYNDNYDVSGTGSYGDVYVRQYDANGVPAGGQIKANTPTVSQSYQYEPAVAVMTNGSFVVTWRSDSQDGSSAGVYAQRFAANGTIQGSEFRVNTYTDGAQYEPDVTALKDGGFIVVWRSDGQDLSGASVYAQRYDASGTTVGTEFRVSTTTSNSQYEPSVTGLENGGWVVSWTDNGGLDGSGSGVFMQQYDASGRQLDGQTRVNTYTYSTQEQPSITNLPDGGFVVAYSSYLASTDQNGDGVPDGGNNTQEIRLQRFSNTAPTLTDLNVSGLEDTAIVLTDELFISGFSDPEGQNLTAVKITTLPAQGTLKLDGVALIPGQEISLADLQADKLVYQGNLNFFGTDEFRWTGSDGIAFAPTPVFTRINLSNVNDAPALQAGADVTAAEGTFFSHAVTLGDPDPDTHQVTVNWGDGTPNSVYSTSADLLNINHYFPDNGNYTVTVTANDQQGQPNSVEIDTFQVAVSNVAPDLTLGGGATVEQNQVYTLTVGNVVDPGTDTVSQYQINWGDGTPVQTILSADLPLNRQVTHTFVDTGAKTIAISLVDEDGTFNNVETKNITVSAPTEVLTVDAGADRVVNEGAFFTQTINFIDPTDAGLPGRLYSVNWGDGNTDSGRTAPGAGSVNIGHTYADGNNGYTVNVTVDDDGAQSNSDTFLVTVNNVAPTLTLSGNGTSQEGSEYTLNIAKSDSGADTITGYSVNWGDGSAALVLTAADLAAQLGNVKHTYADGTVARTITVEATDEDGIWSQTKDISVNDVAPTIALGGADAVNEGATYTLNLGAVTDPGQDVASSYTINWGDGNAEVVTSIGNVTHVYTDGNATRTISVLVTDEEGQHANAGSKQVTVNNVAPVIALTGAASVNEGSEYVLTVGTSSDPGADLVSQYTINWGDGSAPQTLTAAQLTSMGRNVPHTYADGAASPTISVDLQDEEGTYLNAGSKSITLNNVAPTIALTGNAAVDEGSVYTLNLAALVDPGTETRTGYSLNWGDGTPVQNFTPAEYVALGGTVQHTFADGAASPTITVSVTDEDGTFLAGSKSITVNNVAPTLALAGAATVNEGATYTLTLGAITDPGTETVSNYLVHWGDGTTSSYAAAGDVTHTYADGASTPTIMVDVVDEDGTHSTAGSKSITVNNVAPILALTGSDTVEEDTTYTLNLGIPSDPGQDTVTSYVINWGDGGSQTINAAGNVGHVYANPGDYAISVNLGDEDGTHINAGSKSVTVNAASATLSLNAGADTALNEGDTLTRTVNFTDGTDNGAGGWSYTIDYGDGTTTNGTTTVKNLDLNHTYTDGTVARTVTVGLTDIASETASDSFQVAVNNVAPIIALSGNSAVDEGTVYTLNLAALVDPGADTRIDYSLNWGDGTVQNFTPAEYAVLGGTVQHTYADGAANRTITVSVTDEDGPFVAGTKSVTVNNVAPSVVLSGGNSLNEGDSYTLNLVGSDPAGVNDTLSYSINWGDGTAAQVLTAADLALVSGNVAHTFGDDENGPINATVRTIQVTVSDEDGGSRVISKDVTVNNIAPTIALTGIAAVDEGSVYTLNLAAMVDPGADTRIDYSLNWGDGTVQNFTPAEYAALGGTAQHTYADGAVNRSITVSVTDEDGPFVAGTKSVTVNNVAPSVVLSGGSDLNEGASYTLNLAGNDPAGVNDTLSYSINWGDSSAAQVLTAAELAAVSGNVAHTFGDDENGPINATVRTIQVTVSDEDGGSRVVGKDVTVHNVAPTLVLTGSDTVEEDTEYTLNLGTPSDPILEPVTSYEINWGDGSTQTVTASGDIKHTYASPATYAISVKLIDDDGTHVNPTGKSVTVNAASATLSLNAGADTALNEGDTLTRTVNFTDGTDNGVTGWSYTIDYGDGTTTSGITTDKSLDLNHTYTDGTVARTVTVGLTDIAGETASDSFQVAVNNVAPTIALTGNTAVDEGSPYTLNLAALVDPGTEMRTGYSLNWSDGTVQNFTPAEYAALGGTVQHTYADGPVSPTITVSVTDEDGTFVAGIKAVAVNNVAPTVVLNGGSDQNEGANYTLNIVGNDPAGVNDTLSYSINWGDGSAAQVLSAAELAVVSGNVTHIFADDENGPVNATTRTIQVTVSDDDGGSRMASKDVTVNNVAPTIALAGADSVNEGSTYTLTLGALTEPGTDTVSSYVVNWGDGTQSTYAGAGDVTHVYADGASTPTIAVDLVDEDGTHSNAGSKSITVNNVVPTIALTGSDTVEEDTTYTLNLATPSDPGQDTVTSYLINWGDGNSQAVSAAGNVGHVYANPGDYAISVNLVDDDGTHTNAGAKAVTVSAASATLSVNAGADTALNEGDTFARTVNFTDGTDNGVTGWSYTIDYGDGTATSNSTTAVKSLDLNHKYADNGMRTVTVSLTDEAGETASDSFQVAVNNVAPTFVLSGSNSLNEGDTYTLNLVGTDPAAANDTLSYNIVWGDGSGPQTLTAAELAGQSGNVTHVFVDDENGPVNATTRTIQVTVADEDGGSSSESKNVTVNNVAPMIALIGASNVAEGSAYTLMLGTVTDSGADAVSSYVVNWGDGSSNAYASAGSVTHVYADGASTPTITVDLVDEDGTHINAGSKSITVNNVAPSVVLSGGNSLNEGATYTLNIVGADPAAANDTVSYSINWGDGSAVQTLTAAQLVLANGNATHQFTDDQDGPSNAATRTIQVTVSDEDGGSSVASKDVVVNNVAPKINVTGAGTVDKGATYTLNLGPITDPGTDGVTQYAVDWGDGTTSNYAVGGNVTHTYAAAGNFAIGVDLADEDGMFADAGTFAVKVNETVAPVIVQIGDAPVRLTSSNPNAWIDAWTENGIGITHKGNYANGAEAWTPVTLNGLAVTTLPGGDLFSGDLGVSGQTALTGSIKQEIDGTEALRFTLDHVATRATVNLARFYVDDDANTFNYNEAGRLQALDAQGNVVAEVKFFAGNSSGAQSLTLDHAAGFSAIVLTAGAYNGSTFVHGAYANDAGQFGTAPYLAANALHGSEFLLDSAEFQLAPVIGVNPDLGV